MIVLPSTSRCLGGRLRPASEADSKFRLLSGTTVLQTRALGAPPARVAEWFPRDGTTPSCIWNLAGEKRGPKVSFATNPEPFHSLLYLQ